MGVYLCLGKEIYQVDLDVVKETIEKCDDIINKVKNTRKTKTKLAIVDNEKDKNLFMFFIEKVNEIDTKKN